MRFFLLLALLASSAAAFAQDPADIFHKTIDLDSVREVTLDVYERDQYEIRTWPGDDILIETIVKLNNCKRHILEFFQKQRRWDLDATITGERMVLASRDKQRRVVKGTEATSSETVLIVLYMPEDFRDGGNGTFRRVSR